MSPRYRSSTYTNRRSNNSYGSAIIKPAIKVRGLYPTTPNGNDFTIYEFSFSKMSRTDWISKAEPIITFIKGTIPISHRSYNGVTKCWEVAAEYFQSIETLAKHLNLDTTEFSSFGPNVHVPKDYAESFFNNQGINTTTTISREEIISKLTSLFGVDIVSLDDAALKREYRKAALKYHPDRNDGNGDMMSELNMYYNMYVVK